MAETMEYPEWSTLDYRAVRLAAEKELRSDNDSLRLTVEKFSVGFFKITLWAEVGDKKTSVKTGLVGQEVLDQMFAYALFDLPVPPKTTLENIFGASIHLSTTKMLDRSLQEGYQLQVQIDKPAVTALRKMGEHQPPAEVNLGFGEPKRWLKELLRGTWDENYEAVRGKVHIILYDPISGKEMRLDQDPQLKLQLARLQSQVPEEPKRKKAVA